jgi:glutamine synthetase
MWEKMSFVETRDVVNFVLNKNIKIINLCHIPEDGKLKTLSFSITDRDKLLEILESGQRVDGSNLFSFIEHDKSDIYIKPNIRKIFPNIFSNTPSLNILCDYLDENGKPLKEAPMNVLERAEKNLQSLTGIRMNALVELEFYVIARDENRLFFQNTLGTNYHESYPFSRFESLRDEVLIALSNLGVPTKYGHSEAGKFTHKSGLYMEQQEIELSLQTLKDLAESIAVTKWVIRNICAKWGVYVSFSPKLSLGHAGNGMHIHFCAIKDGFNIIANPDGTLSEDGLKCIGGILRFAPSLTSFGNPTPVSYLRFLDPKESPTYICWGERNRTALIRLPLWGVPGKSRKSIEETIEYRAPDPFANNPLLLAGMVIALIYAFENQKEAVRTAEELHIEYKNQQKKLKMLPKSCWESAENLEKDRKFYEARDVFTKNLIDKIIEKLKSYGDHNLWKIVLDKPDEAERLMQQYIHYG